MSELGTRNRSTFDPYLTPRFRDLTNNVTKQNSIAEFDRKFRLKIPTVDDQPYSEKIYKPSDLDVAHNLVYVNECGRVHF